MSDSAALRTATTNEKNKKKTQTLIDNEDEKLSIHGYKPNWGKCVIVYIFYLLTAGLLRLFFHWFPIWGLYATHSKCFLSVAEKILVVDKYRGKYTTYYVEGIRILQTNDNRDAVIPASSTTTLISYLEDRIVIESSQIRMVSCKHVNYIWHEETDQFIRQCGFDQERKCYEFHELNGLTKTQQLLRGITYGKNETLVPVQTVLSLLLIEALTPFYIFQVFSLIVWFAEGYCYYTFAIMAMSVFGITSSIIQTRRNQRTLREFHSSDKVTVRRDNGDLEEILSSSLVPGDIIEIPKYDYIMQCDAVLLNGTCIVNESMLTGESVPVTKTPILKTNSIYDAKEDCFHTLYCGTKIIQTQNSDGEKVYAVVLRTGFLTTKGELLRSILYPPPSDFKFDQDSYKFIMILSVIATGGFLYTIISKSDRSIAASDYIIKALDLITIVIPPALPAAMTVGKLYALGRLKAHQIFCLNSRVINVSGSIDCVCFDKTGTLTEDGLELWGVAVVNGRNLESPVKQLNLLPPTSELVLGMATCHSIVVIDKQLLGDPLDMKVFESTGYILEAGNLVKFAGDSRDQDNQVVQLDIHHRFQFSSTLQRMSVIIKSPESSNFIVYCKGSPEMIASLSKPETVPFDLDEKLKQYTGKGYRVIAMASKRLDGSTDVYNLERTHVETELTFEGIIIFENCVKPETPDVIHNLRKANLKTIMITGDNFLTAISVAKECGIISNNEVVVELQLKHPDMGKPFLSFIPITVQNMNGYNSYKKDVNIENGCNIDVKFAVTGSNWALVYKYFPERVSELIERGVVFARMSGKQKQQLIQELQKSGYYVAMCGDGANDCGALTASHVGISLSEEESSVASPFTSKTANISCVSEIIKEGRAALTTSIGVFKFMICYSLAQFTSVIVLYSIDSNLTQIEFLFIDICLVLNFVSIFGKTKAYDGPLDKKRPLSSLLSFSSVASISLQTFLIIFFQFLAYKLVQTYDWFVPFQFDPTKDYYSYTCYENYAVFSVAIFQYMILAFSFSKGKPFRMPIYTNKLFSASLLLTTVICIYVITYPAEWILVVLELVLPPNLNIVVITLSLVLANLVCSLLVEDVLLGYVANSKKWRNVIRYIIPSKKCMGDRRSWQPPSNPVDYGNSKSSIIFEKNLKPMEKAKCGYLNDSINTETS